MSARGVQNRRESVELTDEELEVLRYYSHGLNGVMIADAMHYSYEWIKELTASARLKLRAKNTPHAIAIAMRQGLLN